MDPDAGVDAAVPPDAYLPVDAGTDAPLPDAYVPSYIVASGGSVVPGGDFMVHTFTTSGTFRVSSGVGDVEVLVVGGGGGGGSSSPSSCAHGGGSGGEVVHSTVFAVGVGTYPVVVGTGGPGGSGGSAGMSGADSTALDVTAHGGVGGGTTPPYQGGVCSAFDCAAGGASGSNYDAGRADALGGRRGAPRAGWNGLPGTSSTITGTATVYGGGGGGGACDNGGGPLGACGLGGSGGAGGGGEGQGVCLMGGSGVAVLAGGAAGMNGLGGGGGCGAGGVCTGGCATTGFPGGRGTVILRYRAR